MAQFVKFCLTCVKPLVESLIPLTSGRHEVRAGKSEVQDQHNTVILKPGLHKTQS